MSADTPAAPSYCELLVAECDELLAQEAAPTPTAPDLAAIEARAKAVRDLLPSATVGPWYVWASQPDVVVMAPGDVVVANVTTGGPVRREGEGCFDARLMVAARNVLPAVVDDTLMLVARVRELEAALSASRGEWRGPPTEAEVTAHAATEGGTWLYRYPRGPAGVLYLHDVSPSPDSRAPEWRPVTLGLDAVPWPTVPR